MKLLRVNMKQLQTAWEPVPTVYERLGGRALIAKLLLEEVPPALGDERGTAREDRDEEQEQQRRHEPQPLGRGRDDFIRSHGVDLKDA